MNWTAVVYGGPMTMALIWYAVDAHKWFKGPKVNIEHQMLGRDGNVIDGGDESGGESSANSFSKAAEDKQNAELA